MTLNETSDVFDGDFILPEDVLFVPAEQLADSVRAALDCADGDIAVTRPGFRSPARLVDEATAALLRQFRPASRIVDAILRFSRERELDPESTLVEAFSALQVFSGSRILVPADSPDATGIAVSCAPGQLVAGFEITALLQCTHDTEVYQARAPDGCIVALKVEQQDAPAGTDDALVREQRIVERIGGALAAVGSYQGRRFIAVPWCDGVPITTRAAEIRNGAAVGWRRRLHALACAVLDRYAELHEQGVCHGDVHGRNILVGDGDVPTLIDFGMGRVPGAEPLLDHGTRAGFGQYLDPESVALLASGRRPRPIDVMAEQFAIAALLYEVLTGQAYLDFSPDAEALYGEVLRDPPLPFTRRGFESWPETEAVLRRALSKKPAERYPSTAALRDAFQIAGPPRAPDTAVAFRDESRAFVDSFLFPAGQALPPVRSLFRTSPVASNDQGASGLAWFLYRVAVLRDDPHALAVADVWSRRAARIVDADDADAFYSPADPAPGFVFDACSVLHRLCGIHYVHALICQARGDTVGLGEQIERFVAASVSSDDINDLTLGRSGTLLAAATLLEATAHCKRVNTDALRERTRALFATMRPLLACTVAKGVQPRQPVSMAHGWVGVIYALMRAARALGEPLPDELAGRLDGVAVMARSVAGITAAGHGTREGNDGSIPGWCNGTAGYVPLFTLAHEQLGDPGYADVAEWAAEQTAAHTDRHGHLCCGLAGRVFALLCMYRHAGARRWLDLARTLARPLQTATLPAEGAARRYSLFWGRLGCALALEELEYPERAAMPFFGDLGWPAST